MKNILEYNNFVIIDEMYNESFIDVVHILTFNYLNDEEAYTNEVYNFLERYDLIDISPNILNEDVLDAFKRNPDESGFKKVIKYLLAYVTGNVAGGIATIGTFAATRGRVQTGDLAMLGGLIGILALAVYRRKKDICNAGKGKYVRDEYDKCNIDAIDMAIKNIKSAEIDSIAALRKANKDEQIVKLKEKNRELIQSYEDKKIKYKNS